MFTHIQILPSPYTQCDESRNREFWVRGTPTGGFDPSWRRLIHPNSTSEFNSPHERIHCVGLRLIGRTGSRAKRHFSGRYFGTTAFQTVRKEARRGAFNETTFGTRRSDNDNSWCLPLPISNENLRLHRPGGGQFYSSAADSKLAGCFVRSQTSLGSDQELSRQAPKYQPSH